METYLAQRRVFQLLSYYGFEATRMLKLAPRISDIPNLNQALQFWTTTLKADTIDAHPDVLFLRPSVYTETFNNLTKVFANTDIPIMLNKCPQIMIRDWPELEEKIDFALITMQARHKEIVHSKYLMYPIEHIRTRYNFLDRCGMYIKPHKKDRKRHYTIPLSVVVETPPADILKMTGLLAEEYNTMLNLTEKEINKEKRDLANEKLKSKQLKRGRQQRGYIQESPEDDFDGDEEDEVD